MKVTAKNAQGETTASPAAKIVTTGSTSTVTITVFTVPNATQYNVYIGSGGSLPADSAMWLQAGISGSNAQQPAIGATVTLADGATVMPSGEVNPAILPLTSPRRPRPPAPPSRRSRRTPPRRSWMAPAHPLMWDGIIAQALNNTSLANGATLGAQVAQPADADGQARRWRISTICSRGCISRRLATPTTSS